MASSAVAAAALVVVDGDDVDSLLRLLSVVSNAAVVVGPSMRRVWRHSTAKNSYDDDDQFP